MHFVLYSAPTQSSFPMQVANSRHRNLAPTRKFSTLVKKMVIELERDVNLYPDGNIVEVSEQASLPPAIPVRFLIQLLVATSWPP